MSTLFGLHDVSVIILGIMFVIMVYACVKTISFHAAKVRIFKQHMQLERDMLRERRERQQQEEKAKKIDGNQLGDAFLHMVQRLEQNDVENLQDKHRDEQADNKSAV